MSHQHTQQSETLGAAVTGHAPQVAVRDGNRLLCPCCGDVLMELEEEGKPKRFCPPKMTRTKGDPRRTWPTLEKIIARQEAQEAAGFKKAELKQAESEAPHPAPIKEDGPGYRAEAIMVPIDPDIAAYEFPDEAPPKINNFWEVKRERSERRENPERPMRDVNIRSRERALRRLKQPPQAAWSYESARFHAWIYYRLKALNLQVMGEVCTKQEEVDALKHELQAMKTEPSPRTSADRVHRQRKSKPKTSHQRRKRVLPVAAEHANGKESLATAPATTQQVQCNHHETKERGPP